MKTTVSPLAELTRADLEGWAELADAAVEPNPFLHPDYVGLAAMYMRPRGLAIVRCEDEGGWAACLPVVPALWHGDVLGPGLAMWRHAHCFAGTPLVAAGAVDDGVHALLRGALARRGVAFLACDWVREGPVNDALARGVTRPAIVTEEFSRGFVTRPEPPAGALAPMSRSRAKTLRRQQRGLAEALGDDVEVVEHTDARAGALRFVELEAAGWKGREGTALASHAGHAAFFVAMCEAFARRDALQLLSLQGAGRTAAMQCNLRAGKAIFAMKVAYDEQLASHSPGMQLEVAALELLEGDERTRWMDSCATPDNALINRLWPEQTTIRTLRIPSGRAGEAMVRATRATLGSARRTRRAVLDRRQR